MARLFYNFEELEKALAKCKSAKEAWDIAKNLEQRLCSSYWINTAIRRASELTHIEWMNKSSKNKYERKNQVN